MEREVELLSRLNHPSIRRLLDRSGPRSPSGDEYPFFVMEWGKGANVLVRLSDRLPVLIDFGSCHFARAQRLTWQSLPPMTPEYFSPRALLFYLHSQGQPDILTISSFPWMSKVSRTNT